MQFLEEISFKETALGSVRQLMICLPARYRDTTHNNAKPPNAFRNRAFIKNTGSNESEVQVIPKNIPATSEGRGESEWLIALVLWLLAALLPLGIWKLRRSLKRKT